MPLTESFAERIPAVVSDDAFGGAWSSSKKVATQRRVHERLEKTGYKLAFRAADQSTTGKAYQALWTDIVPAGAMSQNGDSVTAEYAGTFAANSNTKNVGVAFIAPQIIYASVTEDDTAWRITVTIVRMTSSAARCVAVFETSAARVVAYTEVTSVDWTANNNLSLVAHTPDDSGDITARLAVVRRDPRT